MYVSNLFEREVSHKICPYHEMDNFDSYAKFVHSDAALCNIPDIPRGLIF